MDARSRNFSFTWNNPPVGALAHLECLGARYVVAGRELAPSTGTPHLQGTILWKSQKTLRATCKLLPGCHVEPCIDVHASIAYCKKDEDFVEMGEPPMTSAEKGAGEKRRWDEILLAAREGRENEIPADIRFNSIATIKRHRMDYLMEQPLEDTEVRMLWYYGASGTGKSRKAREDNPDAYLKTANKWWDGYKMEDTVIIEDLDKRHDVLAHHIKIWGDRYPFPCEVKGGYMKIRPKLIIVTSNYHPKDIWNNVEDLEPILRRFKVVHFNPPMPITCGAQRPTHDPRCAPNFPPHNLTT